MKSNGFERREQKLREESGSVVLADDLTSFFYLLMRDYVPAGKVEKIIRDTVNYPEKSCYTNGYLAKYAESLANELRDGRMNALAGALESAFDSPPEQDAEKKDSGLEHMNITSQTANAIEEAYNKLSDEERAEAEKALEAGQLESVKELSDSLSNVLGVDEWDNDTEAQERLKYMRHIITTINSDQDSDKREERMSQIKHSLEALDKLRNLVPSDAVNEVAKILEQEVRSEIDVPLDEGMPSEDNQLQGVFKRVHSDLDIEDNDIAWSKDNE